MNTPSAATGLTGQKQPDSAVRRVPPYQPDSPYVIGLSVRLVGGAGCPTDGRVKAVRLVGGKRGRKIRSLLLIPGVKLAIDLEGQGP
jgi:hypothetical protein